MSFLSVLAEDTCPICFEELSGDAVAHENNGKMHPIHRKCLEIWAQTQKQATCPSCRININSIEPMFEGLFRASVQGNLELVKEVIKINNYVISFENSDKKSVQIHFSMNYDFEVIAASANGHSEMVSTLLKSGKINNSSAGLALQFATEGGHFDVAKTLMQERRERWETIPDENLKKALDLAKAKNYQNIVDLLEFDYKIRKMFKKFG